MEYLPILGLLAGSLTTIAFIPQVIKTWKSKSAKELSLGMFLFFFVGLGLWFIYGILMQDLPIIVANGLMLILAATLIFFKLTFKD
jgi:MtN3 and saliva related transmembrane protein